MNVILNLVQVAQVLAALVMIGLILMQHGKGADMGAAFGSGASGSIFGASGSANFFSRATAVMATVFLGCTLALAYFGFSVRTPRRPAACWKRRWRRSPQHPAPPRMTAFLQTWRQTRPLRPRRCRLRRNLQRQRLLRSQLRRSRR
ncbi:MAG: preprotein translocase subunit SecG, partial [Ottowia sp.]|nr:preprotein translocase subunit SecG [Ottowia sp.]